MSAPPLIHPPATQSRFPPLNIPNTSNSDAKFLRHPDQYLHESLVPTSLQAWASSGMFSPEVLAVVNGKDSAVTGIRQYTTTASIIPPCEPYIHVYPEVTTPQSPTYKPPNRGSSRAHSTSGRMPFPFPVKHSPSLGSLNIDTNLSIPNYYTLPAQGSPRTDDSTCDPRFVPYVSSVQDIMPTPSQSEWEQPQQHMLSTIDKYKCADVENLDEDGWNYVAQAGLIDEIGRLGEGAGGSVTRCKLRTGSTVFALKAIASNPNPELQKQILRELQFNRTCNSPHIVKYYGTILDEQCASIFIAMEYCEGGSLEAIYKRVKARGGRIGEKVLGKLAEGVLDGLSYLHDRRIIHRDIKPQNILLDIKGQVKLCDFGVSGEVVNSLATTFTGTSYYMAPERIQGQPYTVTSDVWSLGLTVMEVAQHRFPFLPENHEPLMPIELLTVIVNMPPPELQDEPTEGIKWSKSFRHFLLCCLEKDPKKRASPRQMLAHPWIAGQRTKVVKMDKFVKECWS